MNRTPSRNAPSDQREEPLISMLLAELASISASATDANAPRLKATPQCRLSNNPGDDHLDDAIDTLQTRPPDLTCSTAMLKGPAVSVPDLSRSGQGDDECGLLMSQLTVLGLPEVFAALGASTFDAH